MKLIELDPPTTERCVQYGRDMVQRYASGGSNRSLAVSSHGAEKDERLQAEGKMAECILSIQFGLPIDPLFDHSLRPWDLRLQCGRRADVKRTKLSGRYLIWPIRKNEIYLSKDFDVLVLVKNDWNRGFARGWLTKQDFYERKTIAGPGHKLDPGTWHVDEDSLEPIELLLMAKLKAMRRELDAALRKLDDEVEAIRRRRYGVFDMDPLWRLKAPRSRSAA